jgi:predicted Zn-dependent protease
MAIPIGFLQFSRGFEREADYLGLQYLYKTGYDPTSFVDFFEKIQSMEKKKPGSVSKVFSTHPMTDDRIKAAQEEIQKILVAKPEYVVNTSEFNDVKARLASLENRKKMIQAQDVNKPTLRKTTADSSAGQSGQPSNQPDDDRPTLSKRTDDYAANPGSH